MTTPKVILASIRTAHAMLDELAGVKSDERALVLSLAIAGQESTWAHRLQVGGPARSYWQFEKGGGVAGVLNHPASATRIKALCKAIDASCDIATVYEAMAWHDVLGAAMARLLLFTDPAALPAVGAVDDGWRYYLRNWRPGAPHPDVWPDCYRVAMQTVAG